VILDQLKNRRKELGLLQKDMLLRVGMTRQQYNQLEKRGNPRLDTLTLLAQGLDMELMLIPKEMVANVRDILRKGPDAANNMENLPDHQGLVDDPWQGILEGD
jgi:transcriptional regulator with XRE-family HTH domain